MRGGWVGVSLDSVYSSFLLLELFVKQGTKYFSGDEYSYMERLNILLKFMRPKGWKYMTHAHCTLKGSFSLCSLALLWIHFVSSL